MAAAAAGADAADAANNQAALLLDAVERGDAAAIDALLAAGADANARVDVDEGGGSSGRSSKPPKKATPASSACC